MLLYCLRRKLIFMNYGVILAGGVGSRIKSIDIPKQYYEIDGVAIIIYTIMKMINTNSFDYIYLVSSPEYMDYNRLLINKFIDKKYIDSIKIIEGGDERIDSVHNALVEISKNGVKDDDIVVIHDGARPFVKEEILLENIKGAREIGAVVTAIPSSDTILVVEDGMVKSVPTRSTIYREQTPTSANLSKLILLDQKLTKEDKKNITGSAEIFTRNNIDVKIVLGDDENFKITTDEDLDRAVQKIKKLNL